MALEGETLLFDGKGELVESGASVGTKRSREEALDGEKLLGLQRGENYGVRVMSMGSKTLVVIGPDGEIAVSAGEKADVRVPDFGRGRLVIPLNSTSSGHRIVVSLYLDRVAVRLDDGIVRVLERQSHAMRLSLGEVDDDIEEVEDKEEDVLRGGEEVVEGRRARVVASEDDRELHRAAAAEGPGGLYYLPERERRRRLNVIASCFGLEGADATSAVDKALSLLRSRPILHPLPLRDTVVREPAPYPEAVRAFEEAKCDFLMGGEKEAEEEVAEKRGGGVRTQMVEDSEEEEGEEGEDTEGILIKRGGIGAKADNLQGAADFAVLERHYKASIESTAEFRSRASALARRLLVRLGRAYPLSAAMLRVWQEERVVGEKTVRKLEQVVRGERLDKVIAWESDPEEKARAGLAQLWGVGKSKAAELVSQGWTEPEKIAASPEAMSLLPSFGARLCAARFTELQLRIPRQEALDVRAAVALTASRLCAGVDVVLGGSMRRGQRSAGDIDLVLTHPAGPCILAPAVTAILQRAGLVAFHLGAGAGIDPDSNSIDAGAWIDTVTVRGDGPSPSKPTVRDALAGESARSRRAPGRHHERTYDSTALGGVGRVGGGFQHPGYHQSLTYTGVSTLPSWARGLHQRISHAGSPETFLERAGLPPLLDARGRLRLPVQSSANLQLPHPHAAAPSKRTPVLSSDPAIQALYQAESFSGAAASTPQKTTIFSGAAATTPQKTTIFSGDATLKKSTIFSGASSSKASNASSGPARRLDVKSYHHSSRGCALVYFAAGDVMNRALREYAKIFGLSLNDCTLTTALRGEGSVILADGQPLAPAFYTEESVFAALGLRFPGTGPPMERTLTDYPIAALISKGLLPPRAILE